MNSNARPAWVLTGPRHLDGLLWHHARELAEHLGADAVIAADNGVTIPEPQPGILTITHADPLLPPGAVQITVTDEAGLLNLVHALRQIAQGVEMVNIPDFLRRHAGIPEAEAA